MKFIFGIKLLNIKKVSENGFKSYVILSVGHTTFQ